MTKKFMTKSFQVISINTKAVIFYNIKPYCEKWKRDKQCSVSFSLKVLFTRSHLKIRLHYCYWLWGKLPTFGRFLNSSSKGKYKLVNANFWYFSRLNFVFKLIHRTKKLRGFQFWKASTENCHIVAIADFPNRPHTLL